MPVFSFRGSITIEGVVFLVEANNEEHAKELADQGFYESIQQELGEICDWDINLETCMRDEE